ncbi:hypothetical protein HDE_13612 [Halotydeus destructor]|nr:hypothetical protein HDE_13612 [Halotydeus destructor]
MTWKSVCLLIVAIIFAICVILEAKFSHYRRTNEIVCDTPRYAPYLWVRNVSSTTMDLGVTDPNDVKKVISYTIYYWGHQVGRELSTERVHRHFGHKVMSRDGPFVIDDLRPGFSYCADVTANNECGHGPFCMACFESVVTLKAHS